MPIDASLAGQVYPPQAYEVSREKIREFADALGDRSPLYRDATAAAERGYLDVIAPLTFAMLPVLRGFDQLVEELGVTYAQVIHVSQRFVHARPIRAGDQLLTTTTLESVRSAAGNDLLGVRCEIAAESGEPVCTATATLLIRPAGGADG
ncbi:MAG TPA: MaoC family dehydratase N-terminal domain-containing protein [Jiangellaceae bacterium]|jgi:acyl dehydratase|nr:MaoC family dehydratase N-terminal domain-containing protein [Jiangellaceae bacterium]